MHDLVVGAARSSTAPARPARTADVAITDGVVTEVGRVDGPAHADDRRRRRARHARVRRHPHPLRRPGHVGRAADAVVLARRHHRGDGQLRRRLRAGRARAPRVAHRPDGGRRGHPRRRAVDGIKWALGALPRVPRRARRSGAGCVDVGTQVPHGAVRGLRHGRARRPQRARHAGRHRGDGRHRPRRHAAPARSGSRPAARSRTAPSTANPCPARSRPRTSCSASAACSASSARACSSSPRRACSARTSPRPSARWPGSGGWRRRSAGPVTFALTQNDADPEAWRRMLDLAGEAAAEGAPVRPQVHGRTVSVLLGFQTFHPFMFCPAWSAAGRAAAVARAGGHRQPGPTSAPGCSRKPSPSMPTPS